MKEEFPASLRARATRIGCALGLAGLSLLFLSCDRSTHASGGSALGSSAAAVTSDSGPSGKAPSMVRTRSGMVATHACLTDADCVPAGYCARWRGLGRPEFFCYPGRHPNPPYFGQPPPATDRGSFAGR